MKLFFRYCSLFIVGTWLGSMLCFSFFVAPSAFAVLPSKHLAGLIVSSVLAKLEWFGFFAGIMLCLLFIYRVSISNHYTKKIKLLGLLLPLLMSFNSGMSKWIVSKELIEIRSSIEIKTNYMETKTLPYPILSEDTQTQFNKLHMYSVLLMVFNFIGGVILFIVYIEIIKTDFLLS